MKLKQEFILREIAEEYILIPVGSTAENYNGLITLTESALFIYNHIDKVDSFDELINLMEKEYDIDRITLINDTAAFITQLLQLNIIEMDDPEKGW